jgi:hypothetical protein
MDMTKFAIPAPIEYKPPSVLYRYRGLLILFLVIFVAAIAVGRHLIEAERNRPLPPAPVYLQNIEEPRQSAPPPTTAAAQREPGATPP